MVGFHTLTNCQMPGYHHHKSFRPDMAGVNYWNLFHSLGDFLFKTYEALVARTVTDVLKALQILTKPDVSFLVAGEAQGRIDQHTQHLSNAQSSGHVPLISFAVASSGKTQFTFNMLAANWGRYLVSGQISESLAHQHSILGPCRGGASADTHWLFQLYARLKADHGELPSYAEGIMTLLTNRNFLLEKWIDLTRPESSNGQLQQGIYWLLFQTTRTPAHDPFVNTLKLLLLLDPCYSALQRRIASTTVIDEV
jgi:hypothetical protein